MLAAARDGFVPPNDHGKARLQRVVLAAGEEKRDLVVPLTPFGVVLGRIVDEDGDPIRRIEVAIMQWHYSSSGRDLQWMGRATTDDRGEYRIFDLKPGRYYLKAGATQISVESDESFATAYYPGTPDPPSASAIDVGAGQEVEGIDLTLRRTHVATVRGRVMNPGAETTVNLTAFRDGGSSTSNNDTAPDGKFVVRGVWPGAYVLTARSTAGGQERNAHLQIQVGSSDPEGIELHLAPPVAIAGQIRIEGNTTAKMPALHVELDSEGRSEAMPEGQTKEDGSFVLENLDPEVYRVSVSAPPDLYLKSVRWSDRDVMQSGLDLTQGAAGGGLVIVMSAKGGAIDGTVEDDQPAPVAGAMVVLIPADTLRKKQLFQAVPTGSNGRFHMTAIAPGSYKLFAFENVDPNRVLYDPEFLRPFEGEGQSIDMSEGGTESVHLKAIQQPAETQ
jgi:protocatechuate 3,4-dioxygenase beta subunit